MEGSLEEMTLSLVCFSFSLPPRARPSACFWLPVSLPGVFPPLTSFYFSSLDYPSSSPNDCHHNLQKCSTPTHIQQQIPPLRPPSRASTCCPLRRLCYALSTSSSIILKELSTFICAIIFHFIHVSLLLLSPNSMEIVF